MARSGSSGIDRFLGHRLKQRRLALGMTRVEFAEALGISHQQMHKYESGTNQLSPHLIFSIAQLFGISVSDLLTDTAAATKSSLPRLETLSGP